MPHEDQFRPYAEKCFGGCVDFNFEQEKPDTLSFMLASFVLQIRKLAHIELKTPHGRALRLNVGVTPDLHGNAYADEYKEQHYISMTFGHFLSNFYFATEAFFRTDCFADIGPVVAHEPSEIDLCPEPEFWNQRGLAFIEAAARIETGNKQRIWGAYFLTYAMTMIAYYHEYYHVIYGHCAVKNTYGLGPRLQETGYAKGSDAANQILRSFEATADQSAIFMLIKSIIRDADLPTSGNVVCIRREDRIRLALVAAGLLSVSWFVWQKRSGFNIQTHPEPGARFIHFFVSAKQILSDCGCGELFKSSAQQAMDDLARISLRCPDLARAMSTIATGKPRSDTIKPIPFDVLKLLEEHQFLPRPAH